MHMPVMASSLMAKLVVGLMSMMAELMAKLLMAMLVMTEMMGMSVMATLLTSMDGNMYNPGVLSCT